MWIVALLLLCELLVLVWEVEGVPVYEFRVRYVVRQRCRAIAALVLSVVVTAVRSIGTTIPAAAVVMAVRLMGWIGRLAVFVWGKGRWKVVGKVRGWRCMPARHDCCRPS